ICSVNRHACAPSVSLPAPARFGPDPKVGDRVTIITPSDRHYIEEFDNVEGRVINAEFNSDNAFHPSFLKIQSSTIDGASGSPVLDSLGNVVGMLTGTLTTNVPVAGFRVDTISIDIPNPSGGTLTLRVPGFVRDTVFVKLMTGHSVAVPASDIVFLIRRSRGVLRGERVMAPGSLTGVAVRVCRQDISGCGEYPVVIVRVLDPDLRRAGVEPNDVLSAVNGTPLFSGADFTRELFLHRAPGEEVELTFLRSGAGGRLREIKVWVILGDGSDFRRGY
ncbi:MAG: trypsin-like peptidase domain-containing protein, partial [Patescibacteria group bacterium]